MNLIKVPTQLNVETPVQSVCPKCKRANDEVVGDGTPSPGDITLCGRCGASLQFNDELRLVEPDGVMQEIMDANPDIQKIRLAIQMANQRARTRSMARFFVLMAAVLVVMNLILLVQIWRDPQAHHRTLSTVLSASVVIVCGGAGMSWAKLWFRLRLR